MTLINDSSEQEPRVVSHFRLIQICFVLFPGSKNPEINLKIAEIRTDGLGKVSAACREARFTGRFLREKFSSRQLPVV